MYIDITDAYDTNAFILCLLRFFSIRGYSKKIISDNGSQLKAASKKLSEMYENWDWNEIIQFGTDKRLEWQFTKSSDAPWENGCSESLIKLAKRNMMTSIGSQVLTFNELQSFVFEIANLLYQRPVGIKSIDKVEMTHLCPNDLILGRASTKCAVWEL